jgi:hypothetical protein
MTSLIRSAGVVIGVMEDGGFTSRVLPKLPDPPEALYDELMTFLRQRYYLTDKQFLIPTQTPVQRRILRGTQIPDRSSVGLARPHRKIGPVFSALDREDSRSYSGAETLSLCPFQRLFPVPFNIPSVPICR